MNITVTVKNTLLFILDLLFPIECLACRKSGVFLCPDCIKTFKKPEKLKCVVCDKPSPFGKTHQDCVSKNKINGLIIALDYHDANVRTAIGNFKYKSVKDLGEDLSQILYDSVLNNSLESLFKTFKILPVPLHIKRLRWRGFNQAEVLGNNLADKLNTQTDKNLIVRVKNTKPQSELKRDQRLINLENAFTLKNPDTDLSRQKFLLVDDVATTGATFNEIAKVLKKAGAEEVWAIAIARD
jgi:ComF family protein